MTGYPKTLQEFHQAVEAFEPPAELEPAFEEALATRSAARRVSIIFSALASEDELSSPAADLLIGAAHLGLQFGWIRGGAARAAEILAAYVPPPMTEPQPVEE